MPKGPRVEFDHGSSCLVDGAGRRMKGITADMPPSDYRGTKGLNRGRCVDAQLTAHITSNEPVTHPYAKRILEKFAEIGIQPKAAQVAVRNAVNATSRRATMLDIVATKGAHDPYIIEVKTTSWTASRFLECATDVDPECRTFFSAHFQDPRRPNTTNNKYLEQLLTGMNMYGNTFKVKEGSHIFGALVVSCADEVIVMEHSIVYRKGTGINTIKESVLAKRQEKKACLVSRKKQFPSTSKPERKRSSRPKPCKKQNNSSR
jgi:hypothetical protein